MTRTNERRTNPGIAIVTERPSAPLKQHYQAAGIPCGVYTVQEHNRWPAHRTPIALDTITMNPHTLIDLLLKPPTPFIAIVEADDRRAQRLLSLCPAVQYICTEEPLQLTTWLDVADGLLEHRPQTALWVAEPPPTLALSPLLLPALQALRVGPSFALAAERCSLSWSSFQRLVRSTKHALGMPPGILLRHRPERLAEAIIERLASV